MALQPEVPYTNHLANEKSPYLLQHAHNPVDWYPWGVEAFNLAKSQDKPIFLSIGYATCHWCHVMERESFEDPEVAKILNDVFINIKVDREELPEVDGIYMEFAQALMGAAGGWPLNVVLTPDLKPFIAVTYLPPRTHRGLIGLSQFALHIKQLWQSEEKALLLEEADKLVAIFEQTTKMITHADALPSELHLAAGIEMLFEIADPVYGGIKAEPKFPLGYQCGFLLQHSKAKGDSRSLFYVELTLMQMYRGGIYDHIGGGFSRYAIDERWLIPHFEKMLYDNAFLSLAYLDAWKFTKKPLYQEVCREILDYICRDMTHPEGGFYSAEDADSEGKEGFFYTWTPEEILNALPKNEGELFCEFYGVTKEGNFEGRSVLHIEIPLEEFAKVKSVPIEQLEEMFSRAKKLLFEKRAARPHPLKDDKILTSWNGLMIDAMARAAAALGEKKYLDAALKAVSFIKKMCWKEGKLYRRFREGEAKYPGGLEDYAALIKGLLTLFEVTGEREHFQWAVELAELVDRDFKAETGAYYQTEAQASLLFRKCELYDGAEPSGNAVHAENLLRLYQFTQMEKYLRGAEEILKSAKNYIEAYPPGAIYHLIALQRYLDTNAPTVIIALDEERTLEKEISGEIFSHFCPHLSLIWKRNKDLDSLLPNTQDKVTRDGQSAVYICKQNQCAPPLIHKEETLAALKTL